MGTSHGDVAWGRRAAAAAKNGHQLQLIGHATPPIDHGGGRPAVYRQAHCGTAY